MNYIFDHTVLYNHEWTDFLFVLVLIIVIVFMVKKFSAMKNEEKILEKQISEIYTRHAEAQEKLPEEMKFEPIAEISKKEK